MSTEEKHISTEAQVKQDGKDVFSSSSSSSVLWRPNNVLLKTFLLITCIKILLIPTYRSTDFEVHRNWLAITYSLPVAEWYVNAQSPWTLDYPPLFAWFEYCLSQVAAFFDPEMLKVENLNYASSATIYFQRGTVILADLIFAYGVREMSRTFCKSLNNHIVFVFLSLCNIGLLIVDHVHFQYNGFLLGILLISMANVSKTGKEMTVCAVHNGAMWFSILLNLKHLYVYVAPAYIVWLLKSHCLNSGKFFRRLFSLGLIVLTVLAVSFGPFRTQLPQVISRLFPFKRGLVHSYWAANGWALYIGAEKVLSVIWKHLGWLKDVKSAVMTGGLVQEQNFLILPTPTPIVTFLLTFVTMLPALWCLLCKKPYMNSKAFIRCIVLCALSSFMFGWHVHEKAILTAIISLCVLAALHAEDARIFIILSSAGQTALLPLLYPDNLSSLKLLLSLAYMLSSILILTNHHGKPLLRLHEWLYVIPLPLVTVYEVVLHKLLLGDKLPFLPLAFTSIYCAIGITYCWMLYYYMYLQNDARANERTAEDKSNRQRLKDKQF
ncbi:putative dolichyl pyrophosphate Glc1Man9GlcNAc2 alpha-1,3-glucosyltransferase [Trachymyrmex zeteki]|uniref:Alpha-1,3-glucosyltransferase n=1 Tax=Mycetomoellerius zeteki TaxID=64791 RepID=A0A151WHV8_9HYME|nr:PREDICTED: probable dolichyl pyrophosphate Glc1Man9GlcNAc2 alpha-1,3-glucosyltransferase [Trachymyrmex zeteki]XP_018314748.1 PREDICTED: probable dolichyl pyrophosphate Glc1Man9GlcNAc2 alpha-1,3-glucosyltransferase [Trachymyrmex zeteki]KYQ47439.1 putative dolichyl pyrophosphate Glc1Man9GlcNAc2 alpha-1,3-glucosyltransferase [Trachymyrmex zeteki]